MTKNSGTSPAIGYSLTTALIMAFVVFSLVTLIGSVMLLWINFRVQRIAIYRNQEIIAMKAMHEISTIVNRNFDILEASTRLNNPFIRDGYQQGVFLQGLLQVQPAFREIILLDKHGQVLVRRSQGEESTPATPLEPFDKDLFQTVSQKQRYFGPVSLDKSDTELVAWIGVPVLDALDKLQGAMVVQIRLNFVWDEIAQLQQTAFAGQGTIYIVDRQGYLLALDNQSASRVGEDVSHLPGVVAFVNHSHPTTQLAETMGFIGIHQDRVIGVDVPLEFPDWAVIIEVPFVDAYREFIFTAVSSFLFLSLEGVFVVLGGFYLSKKLAKPLQSLTETADHIAAGQINLTVSLDGPDEVRRLGAAFNQMTAQLRESIDTLEQRVTTRTQRLELVATLSEKLAVILDLEQLLQNLVTAVKSQFNYYHVHVYLFDDLRQNLVMTAGFGEAGAKMKARGHHIPANAVTSLVARAARSGEIVWVDDVRQAIDWLPNPLLPETRSEMAVPISLAGQVVGVLDVQENHVVGFDESDAALLRSLANQVAIAIRNARLFTEVEAALHESHEIQERYLTQSWHKAITALKQRTYTYQQPNAPALPLEVMAQAKLMAFEQTKPTFLPLNEETKQQPLVAPIRFMGQAIGTLQLHRLAAENTETPWGANELAIVEAVIDQVAQAAENLRLFEETRERAQREQVIREITDKLRTAPNLNSLLDVATRELGQRLGVRHTVLELGVDLKNVRASTGIFEVQK